MAASDEQITGEMNPVAMTMQGAALLALNIGYDIGIITNNPDAWKWIQRTRATDGVMPTVLWSTSAEDTLKNCTEMAELAGGYEQFVALVDDAPFDENDDKTIAAFELLKGACLEVMVTRQTIPKDVSHELEDRH